MQEHNKIQLYVGLEEGGCVDVGAINLVGFTLIETSELQDLKAERDTLAAQVQALRREIQSAADWFSAYWPELNKAQCDRIRQMDNVAKATPQHHLAELRAEAGRAGFVAGYFHYKHYGFQFEEELDAASDKYAEQIRREGE